MNKTGMSKSAATIILGLFIAAFLAGRYSVSSADLWLPAAPTTPASNPIAFSSAINAHQRSARPVNSKEPVSRDFARADDTRLHVAPAIEPTVVSDHSTIPALLELALYQPAQAMQAAKKLRGESRLKAKAAILAVWGRVAPDDAWRWVVETDPSNMAAYQTLLQEFGQYHSALAQRYTRDLAAAHPDRAQDIYVATLSGMTRAGDYEAAKALVDSVVAQARDDTSNDVKNSADNQAALVHFVVTAWAAYAPQAAQQWVMGQTSVRREAGLTALADAWADQDPQAAAKFALTLTAIAQQSFLQHVLDTWLDRDVSAAMLWLGATQDAGFDEAISRVATQPLLMRNQSALALSWASRIVDPARRLRTIETILSDVKGHDIQAAAHYVVGISDLTAAQRRKLASDLGLQ